ncbi:hypothetical protein [Desulfurobacterium atlanticum]|uniref:Uncharacterized protein n=1 Tax=Desulfurobacterium atlanticum TaxID=240169 RepID=A0A239AD04_9BACT|nr:hypothetical protein [Desulfurobacterium atlanticum]SNR92783.1 hypothetical protein SAMN06265340_11815 [Desulfurobacterium atlanticum]
MRKTVKLKKTLQIFSVILLARDLLVFYKKNRKTIHMLINHGQKLIQKKKRKAGR